MSLFKTTKGAVPYRGITMMTAAGVHDAAQRLIEAKFKNGRSKLRALDLASGQGALAQRVKDLKFGTVDAWEIDIKQFKVKGVKVRAVDLNKDFPAVNDKYDLITACEIIEHLENPYHFLREISKILAPKGVLILSTPNIESATSRIDYLIDGNPRWFDDYAHDAWGHIMPVSRWLLAQCLNGAGMVVKDVTSNSTDATMVVEEGTKSKLKGLLGLALYPFMEGNKAGDINVWAIQHKAD